MLTEQALIIGLGAVVVVLLVIVLLLGYLLGLRARDQRSAKGDLVPLPPTTSTTDASVLPAADLLAPALQALRTELHTTITDLQQQVHDLRVKATEEAAANHARRTLEDQTRDALQRVERALAPLDHVSSVQRHLQEQIANALRDINAIKTAQTEERQRWPREDDAFAALQRLTAVMLGSARVGAAGERLVGEALSNLPPQWLIPNHRVNGQPVEFAIRLPDGRILPIDSKFVAQSQLDQLEQETDANRRGQLEKQIQGDVSSSAAKVRQYLDDRSAGFAIAAVPDAAYTVCGPILARVYQEHHVLIVPYSLVLPFVLMVYEQHRHTGLDWDAERLARLLTIAQSHLEHAQQEVNGRMGDALKRLQNGHSELATDLAEAARALAQIHTPTSA